MNLGQVLAPLNFLGKCLTKWNSHCIIHQLILDTRFYFFPYFFRFWAMR